MSYRVGKEMTASVVAAEVTFSRAVKVMMFLLTPLPMKVA